MLCVSSYSVIRRGGGTTLKLGGGGQTTPGVQGNPYPKLKNSPDLAHYFIGETQVHVQKQTKVKMNDIDSPKLEGGAPTASKLWGPLPPGSRVPGYACRVLVSRQHRWRESAGRTDESATVASLYIVIRV